MGTEGRTQVVPRLMATLRAIYQYHGGLAGPLVAALADKGWAHAGPARVSGPSSCGSLVQGLSAEDSLGGLGGVVVLV